MSGDPSYDTKVYLKQGGDELRVKSGGTIVIDSGGAILADGVTSPTETAPNGNATTTSTPFGFDSQAQGDAVVTWIRSVDAQLRLVGIIK
jgi:hypothetical protein